MFNQIQTEIISEADSTLRVLENRVFRRIYGPKREAGRDCIMRNLITFTLYQIVLE
jgi:hypothetical protein